MAYENGEHVPKFDQMKVVELYLQGYSCPEIMEELKLEVSIRHIQRFIRGQGITRTRSEAFTNSIARGRMVYQTKAERVPGFRKTINARVRYEVMRRDHGTCVICGRTGAQDLIEVDHINNDPTDNAMTNLRALCQTCNIGKELARRKAEGRKASDAPLALPKPKWKRRGSVVVYCERCDDVTLVKSDTHGNFCTRCTIAVSSTFA